MDAEASDDPFGAGGQRRALQDLLAEPGLLAGPTALQELCWRAVTTLGVRRAAVWGWADSTQSAYVCQASYDARAGPGAVDGWRLRRSELADYYDLLIRDRLVTVTDFRRDERLAGVRTVYGDDIGVTALCEASLTGETGFTGSFVVEATDGPRTWSDDEAAFVGMLALLVSVTLELRARQEAELRWRGSEQRYLDLLANMVEGVFQTDAQGYVTLANPAMAALMGYADPESLIIALNADPGGHFHEPGTRRRLLADLARHGRVTGRSITLRRADGARRVVEVNARIVRDSAGHVARIDGTADDITQRRQVEEQLRRIAYVDAVSGLWNRAGVMESLDSCAPEAGYALVMVDIADFQTINDGMGQEIGDVVLYKVAERLKRLPGPVRALGRDQSDVFLAALAPANDGAIEAFIQAVQSAFTEPIRFATGNVPLSVAIGSARVPPGTGEARPGHRPGAWELLRRAGVALKRAKSEPATRALAYDPTMDAELRQRLATVRELAESLRQGGFEAVFQPQLDLAGGETVAVEALARWRRGASLLGPASFITAAEESGYIAELGDAILNDALSWRRAWKAAGKACPPGIAVNVSPRELRDPGFPGRVEAALKRWGCPPAALELEITESAVMEEMHRAAGMLARLRALGVRLAVDDFGTGYSSLAYLHTLPVDRLKIDRGFVQDLPDGGSGRSIVRTVVFLARELGLATVAEGVETAGQYSAVQQLGCDCVQGYYTARPMSPSAIPEFVARAAAHDTGAVANG